MEINVYVLPYQTNLEQYDRLQKHDEDRLMVEILSLVYWDKYD
jgi:hypothetical protein